MPARDRIAPTVDAQDVARFDRLGAEWWALDGPMRALHRFNPTRVAYLTALLDAPPGALDGLRILDIGCGGGILAEPLARRGASVTGIDPAPHNIEVARAHAAAEGLAIDYRCTTAEALAAAGEHFDAVLAMEVIEHVRDPAGFLRTAGALVAPGGKLVVATLNRTLKSYALAIVGAEYVLGWVARGTHDWQKFLTPAEVAAMLRKAGFAICDRTGVSYDVLGRRWRLSSDLDVNYMLAAARSA
jgi:2-polyprenyl-6-hydroxyphenyl methylase/3-demethylubiquinone-9 3-methyltransferase